MGIHGLLKHLGSGKRTSLATYAAEHYIHHGRPLRLAIDISIWLFQIQAGQGGSNPALRTFYYRLLRLISLNIDPLFVFDGPNKPLFKRNKRVGGPGVRVANVPEFLAKQLLKQFGFPMHIAPGEAEAECAFLQRHGLIDAVLSEDVDTIMFGSGLTLRNWSAEGNQKTPTHVNIYDASIIEKTSGLDSEGMILVALMSGGDYIPEGIPGCGPTFAVNAAKAGYGKRLCALSRADAAGLAAWREELQMEFRTNASKYFSRRNTTLVVPSDFPNFDVLGYYTRPCVSTLDKVQELRGSLRWDLTLDLAALRAFAGDAFEWYSRSGAIKFIRNLAPALLLRGLRLSGEADNDDAAIEQEKREGGILQGIHNARTHASTDNAAEMRVSFIPARFVPIDLSQEPIDEEDDMPAANDDDAMLEVAELGPVDDVPATPSRKKRTFREYVEGQAEKMWVLRDWVQMGCPLMLETYDSNQRVPKPKAKAVKTGSRKTCSKAKQSGMPADALMRHVRVTKAAPTRKPNDSHLKHSNSQQTTTSGKRSSQAVPQTPSGRKRFAVDLATPHTGRSAITGYFSATPRRQEKVKEVVSLLSSSPTQPEEYSPTRGRTTPVGRPQRTGNPASLLPRALQTMSHNAGPDIESTAPSRRRGPLQKSLSLPVSHEMPLAGGIVGSTIECLDLAESPVHQRIIDVPVIAKHPLMKQSFKSSSSTVMTPVTDTAAIDLSYGVPIELPTVRPRKALRTPRSFTGVAPNHEHIPNTMREKPTAELSQSALQSEHSAGQPRLKKPHQLIILRESLDGTWTTSAKPVDRTDRLTRPKRTEPKTWRMSGVDVLDLTDT